MADKPKPTLNVGMGQQGNWYGRPGVTGGVEMVPYDAKRMDTANKYMGSGDYYKGVTPQMLDWVRKPGPDDILQYTEEADPQLLDAIRHMMLNRGM